MIRPPALLETWCRKMPSIMWSRSRSPGAGARGALGLAGGVVDLAHLVHVYEGVQGSKIHVGEGAAHREPLALEPDGAVVTEAMGRFTWPGSGWGRRGR